jgi:hypothetical protein
MNSIQELNQKINVWDTYLTRADLQFLIKLNMFCIEFKEKIINEYSKQCLVYRLLRLTAEFICIRMKMKVSKYDINPIYLKYIANNFVNDSTNLSKLSRQEAENWIIMNWCEEYIIAQNILNIFEFLEYEIENQKN